MSRATTNIKKEGKVRSLLSIDMPLMHNLDLAHMTS